MTDLWKTLAQRIEYASFVPTLHQGIERSDMRRGDGTPYAVLKNPRGDDGAGTYLQLEGPDIQLYEFMDGSRTVRAILLAHLVAGGSLALDRLARLVGALRAGGFFGEPPTLLYERLLARRRQSLPARAATLLRGVLHWEIAAWRNADRPVDWLYRAGPRFIFTPYVLATLGVLGLGGVVLWAVEFASPRFQLLTFQGSAVLGVVVLLAVQALSIPLHEAGHALAVRHFGRRVRRVGVLLYYLMPTAYVDATDIALAPRGRRIAVSLAGPFADLLIVAACGYIAWLSPEGAMGSLAFKAGTLLMFDLVLNLMPILELDGYHVLTEALEAPFLRQRALAFVRSEALGKVRCREPWSRAELGLAAFGLLAIISSALVVLFAFHLWSQRLAAPVGELLAAGPVGALLVALIAVALLGPTLLRLPSVAGRAVRAMAGAPERMRRRATINDRVAALRRVAFLSDLGPHELVAVATHLGERRFGSGDVVVTIGEPGDRFYIVRSGALEAVNEHGEHLNAIGAGEGFGELALLDRTTRSATVRAVRESSVWWLDRAHFQRWVAARVEVVARIRASSDERAALARLPIFTGLAAPELDRVAARLRLSTVRPGDAVFRAGETADRYYVIRSGGARVVLPDGTTVRELEVGDAFGELGLLLSVPRTASVIASSDLVLASLAGDDFTALVRASGDRLEQLQRSARRYTQAAPPRPG
jgi:putative peptide zinc metalloprotease protein